MSIKSPECHTGSGASDYLPGCYRNVRPVRGESFAGYVLRLSELNGYAGIRDLLAVRSHTKNKSLAFNLIEARSSASALADLGKMAIGNAEALSHYLVQSLPDQSFLYRECRIAHEAMLVDRASICPFCLADSGWAHEDWDLTALTVCTTHRVMLRDECAICHEAIRWSRGSLHHCGMCGADLRDQPTRSVGADVCEVADDFGALAPFRVETVDHHIDRATWEEMVYVFKALVLPAQHWARGAWDNANLTDIPLTHRHQATEALARIHERRCYKITQLAPVAGDAVRPLSTIPRQNVAEQQIYKVLLRSGGISEHVAEAISGFRYVKPKKAYEVFSNRPPSIQSPTEIARFLNVDLETVEALRSTCALASPNSIEVGFDMDQLLEMQRFLSTQLLTIKEIESIVGIPVEPDDLVDSGLLPRWNPRDKTDSRVRLDFVCALHCQLTACWKETRCVATGIPIADLARDYRRPFRYTAEVVRLILGRELQIVGWALPFTWSSIEVESRARDLVNKRMSSSLNFFPIGRTGSG